MNPMDICEIRKQRLELVLLGMAIVSKGATKIIKEKFNEKYWSINERRKCFDAICSGDREGIMSWLNTMGVVTDEKTQSVITIINKLNSLNDTQRIREKLDQIRRIEPEGTAAMLKSRIDEILSEE